MLFSPNGKPSSAESGSSFCTAYMILHCNAICLSHCSISYHFMCHRRATTQYFIARAVNVFHCIPTSVSCLLTKTKRQGHSLSTSRILIRFTFSHYGEDTSKLSMYTIAAHATPQKHSRSCTGYFVLISTRGVEDE